MYVYTHTHALTHTLTCKYIGWKLADSHRLMQITFGVIANHFGQLIRNIFGSLRISLGRLRITFVNGFAKRLLVRSHFLEKFFTIRSNSAKQITYHC